jgi:hypothetical protein
MASHAFRSLFEVDSSTDTNRPDDPPAPTAPQKAFARKYHSVPLPQGPNAVEMDHLQYGANFSAPGASGPNTSSGTQTPKVTDLEMSRPASPRQDEQDGVDTVQSFSNPPMNRFRMVAVSLLNLGGGLNDSAPGALIPYIEK